MGLMGYIRSGIRQYWHVYGVMRDTSSEAFIPTHGQATATVSLIVFLFFLMIAAVFALALRSERREGSRS
jgi:cytochrome bd-type quinol oxidase subunit 1